MHLGGALGLEAGFGRKVRGLKVTSDELPDYVERVLQAVPGGARGRRAVRHLGGPGQRGGPVMSERAAPFYCPYCGDEDLRPSEAGRTARGNARRAVEPFS